MIDDGEAVLATLERLTDRRQQRAFLALLMAAVADGHQALGRAGAVLLRDGDGAHPYGLDVGPGGLALTVRRPALTARPALTTDLTDLFAERARVGTGEVRVAIADESDAEALADLLFGATVNHEYAIRISA